MPADELLTGEGSTPCGCGRTVVAVETILGLAVAVLILGGIAALANLPEILEALGLRRRGRSGPDIDNTGPGGGIGGP